MTLICSRPLCDAPTREDLAFRAEQERYNLEARRYVCVVGHSTYLRPPEPVAGPRPARVCSMCAEPFEPPPRSRLARKCPACITPNYRQHGRKRKEYA